MSIHCSLLGRVLFVVLNLLATMIPRPCQAERPEVWIHHGNWGTLAEGEEQWSFVAANVDGFQFFIDSLKRRTPEQLARLGTVLKANNIAVSVECGGTLGLSPLDNTVGKRSARIELKKLRALKRAGIQLDYLNLDGSVRRLLYPNAGAKRKRRIVPYDSVDRAVDQLIVYLHAVREEFPEVQFFALTNFPNWGYKGDVSYHARGPRKDDWGDYFKVIETIIRKTKKAGVSIAGVTVDNPYDYAIGEHRSVKNATPKAVDWIARVLDLERYVEAQGLEFNLIVNSERGGHESDKRFCEETLAFVDLYLTRGGSPKRLIVESWYAHPRAVVPETAPHTMTALVKAVIDRTRTGSTAESRQSVSKRLGAGGK